MSPLRRIVSFIGIVMLLISLMFLAGSLWPAQRSMDRQPLSPDNLALPTPQSAVPGLLLGMIVLPPMRLKNRNGFALLMIAALLVACGGAATLAPTEFPAATASEPLPTLESTAAVVQPTPIPRPPESRAVELDYPFTLRLGDSDVIRLALVVAEDGYVTPTAESGGHVSTGEPVQIPNLYDTHTVTAIARLDSAGLTIDRPGDWEQPLLPGENVVWRWAIAAEQAGRQRANIIIRLRFIPKDGGDIRERELWARTLTIETTTVFGLRGPVATGFGAIGSVLGAVLGFPFADKFYSWLWGRIRRKKSVVSNQ
ncbi:MAG TPA: hypothetical protein VJL59_19330 [Anaerolineales bacterium]|nr:hypothetical protein [Anaerolineales bacterium]